MKPVAEMTRLEFAAFVAAEFRRRNINVVLSGGSCVSIYSQEKYVSMDLDFVNAGFTKRPQIKEAMEALSADLDALAAKLNTPGASGARFLPVSGEIMTEIEASALLSGASADLIAGGGVGGAEGSVWLSISGTPEQMHAVEDTLKTVGAEPAFGF